MIFLKNLLFSVLVPGTVAGLVPYWILTAAGQWRLPHSPVAALPGLILLCAGLGIYLRCVTDFGAAGGTPAPIDPPKQLVVRGLYRFSRNPMYMGVLSIIAGQALLFASLRLALYAAAVFGMFHSFVVLYEEPTLRRQFGASYEQLCAGVPRWLGRPHPPR
jgi:protein-S-isoprenylcysteine O-methyltransferase Ste14